MAQFKIKCTKCKINYVITTARNSYGVTCFDCNKKDMIGEITDPEMKKLFDIPEELYKQSGFLRSIKINYLKYGKLSDKQIEFFKKVVEDIKSKNSLKEPKQDPVMKIEEKLPEIKKKVKKSVSKKSSLKKA